MDLWSNIKDENIEILAFPCNQFGQQEPESNDSIAKFAKGKGVDFTMMSKVNVNGPNASLVYKYLKNQAGPSAITWNFGTYRESLILQALFRVVTLTLPLTALLSAMVFSLDSVATYFVVSPDGDITSHSGVEPMGLLQYSLDLLKADEL